VSSTLARSDTSSRRRKRVKNGVSPTVTRPDKTEVYGWYGGTSVPPIILQAISQECFKILPESPGLKVLRKLTKRKMPRRITIRGAVCWDRFLAALK